MRYQQYISDGISVIPLRDKAPNSAALARAGWLNDKREGTWKPAQEKIAEPEVLSEWFDSGSVNIGVVGGKVSRNLVLLDFDSRDAYAQWAGDHRSIVTSTPVCRTSQGYHVYTRVPDLEVATFDFSYKGIECGEVRANGAYVVAPTSLHPSGVYYEWANDWMPIIEVAWGELDIHMQDRQSVSWDDLDISHNRYYTTDALLRRMANSKSGDKFRQYFSGDCSAHKKADGSPDRSAAHFGFLTMLAFWTSKNPEWMREIFEQSGMLRDPKYREKWYTGYSDLTIRKAIAGTTDVLRPKYRKRADWRLIS